ncbi:ferrochelatase-domain-containing protein [Ochromonadaceae sp. CCMP2298]|nr:ferrochelatase-domain-containing protein [Ochromonadaceae sp. CCMP2298]|mmetsp:Transcript_31826/g.68597  ORF Transcript_31826/g.68597 Transcript_31826/m.68597 type:complete len:580 (+) Transcript_31826:178-1917(+)
MNRVMAALLAVCLLAALGITQGFHFNLNNFFQRSTPPSSKPASSGPSVGPHAAQPLRSTIPKPFTPEALSLGSDFKQNLKLGVLFLNLGGPESMQDVEGFLFNLFKDPDIIRLPQLLSPLQIPLAYFIAKRRAPKSSEAYESIGGGSPIVKYTKEQSELVQAALRRKGFTQAKCYFAMRYWYPFTEEALAQVKADGVNTLVVVPLYPQFSVSTSGSSLKLLQEIFYRNPDEWGPSQVAHTVVPAWYHRPGYIRVMAKLILEQVVQYSETDMAEGLHVLFSAHGVPESYIKNGDPYQKQIEECVKLISREVSAQLASDTQRPKEISAQLGKQLAGALSITGDEVAAEEMSSLFPDPTGLGSPTRTDPKEVQFHLSFQSRVGPVQWLAPYTDDMLRNLGEEKKVKNLIVVPVSFVSEHIETLEEIDMEYRELALEAGITNWRRVPALNTDKMFIDDMAELVLEALEAPTLTVAEAASKSYSDMLTLEQPLGDIGPTQIMGSSGSARRDYLGTRDYSMYAEMGVDMDRLNIGLEQPYEEPEFKLTEKAANKLSAMAAMVSVLGTSVIELINHNPILQTLGFK